VKYAEPSEVSKPATIEDAIKNGIKTTNQWTTNKNAFVADTIKNGTKIK
jgi:hypothetical protein